MFSCYHGICKAHVLLVVISIIIISIFLFFLYQLEEHVTYLVCEVELNKTKKTDVHVLLCHVSRHRVYI